LISRNPLPADSELRPQRRPGVRETLEPLLQRRNIRMIGDLIEQEFEMTADFPRRHDGRDVELLEFQLSWRRRLGREMSRLATAPGSQRGVDQRTKRVRHDRVE